MFLRWLVGGLAIALLVGAPPLRAQRQPQQRPLGPQPDVELRVAPFFDGFYANPDGTITFSFGYSNLNREETVEIPLGPDNFIEPKEFDGRQPTSFPPVVPDAPDGGRGRPDRRDRERGVFTVTVPAGFTGDVVWTLRHRGQTYSVPGRAKNSAYSLRWPMAMGSIPPLLRFTQAGPAGRGPTGIDGGPMQASVGAPLSISVSIVDDSKREKEPIEVKAPGANPKAGDQRDLVQALRPGSGHLRARQAADPGAARHGDDVGDLQAAGRIRDPRARRQLRTRRHVGRQPVLLDERLHEGRRETLDPPETRVVTYAVGPLAHAQRVWRATT